GPGRGRRVLPLPIRGAGQRVVRSRGGRPHPRRDRDQGPGMSAGGEDLTAQNHPAAGRLGDGIPYPEAAAGFPREPDGFQRLWTPHRMVYIDGQDKPNDSGVSEYPFCTSPTKSDAEGLIVGRGQTVFAVLNLYPYNHAHLLIFPYCHVADYHYLNE